MMSAFAVTPEDPMELTVVWQGEDLTLTQHKDLMKLVVHFSDVLSSIPGFMHLVHHKIKTLPRTVVRQQQSVY